MFARLALPLFALVALTWSTSAFALSATHIDYIGWDDLGYVANGESITYTHFFEPYNNASIEIQSIDSSFLYVTVLDDFNCAAAPWNCVVDWALQPETAVIDLNEVMWQSGSATARIFWGEVTAEADLLNNNGLLDIRVSSDDGDFQVLSSRLITDYSYTESTGGIGGGSGPGGGAATPEPNAALVFAIGTLVVGSRVRRR